MDNINENNNLLEINNLVVHYEMEDEVVEAVNNISFSVKKGEAFGIIGETGAGKTTVALSIMRLLPEPRAHIISGDIKFGDAVLTEASKKEMTKIRGRKISMIFQDPMTALNPVKTVGDQITEVILLHQNVNKAEATILAMDMLETVGIRKERFKDYPHQFSGGMKQRVVIAIALACEPELLIADEPTTALDVTIQAQVLELMKHLQQERNTAMIMITHDFGVVADICQKCAVTYAGEIVEIGTVEHIFNNPKHPYTVALFGAIPSLDKKVERLHDIQGLMSDPANLPSYCSFYDRCDKRCDACKTQDPILVEIEPGHFVKCKNFVKEKEDK